MSAPAAEGRERGGENGGAVGVGPVDGDATLALEGVRVVLGDRDVLAGVDATLRAGEVTALVGPNGAGKTTLLRAVIGAVPLAGGRVLVNGRPRHALAPRELARAVALVPQDLHIDFSFRVEEVVLMGRHPHLRPLEREGRRDLDVAAAAMRRLAVEALRDRDVTSLSQGELQRVLVARALATEARIVLLDEPTSHLDVAHRLDLLALLAELARSGFAIGVVLHDLDLATRCADRLVVLDAGRVAGAGEPARLLAGGVLERVFGVRLERVSTPAGEALTIFRRRDGA